MIEQTFFNRFNLLAWSLPLSVIGMAKLRTHMYVHAPGSGGMFVF